MKLFQQGKFKANTETNEVADNSMNVNEPKAIQQKTIKCSCGARTIYCFKRCFPLLVECKDVKFHEIFMKNSDQISHCSSMPHNCVWNSYKNP